jgi:F0F1-type ATP synthase assembly protein I
MATEEPEPQSWGREYGPFLTIGIQLAVAVVAFFFLGRWLDSLFGSAPWLMLAGLALGITGGLVQFLKTALRLGRREDAEAEGRRHGS